MIILGKRAARPVSIVLIAIYTAYFTGAAYSQSVDTKIANIEKYCYKPNVSMVDGRACVADQLARTRRSLDAAVRKRHFEIDEVGRKSPDDGSPYGAETADKWRAAFKKEQTAWVEYEKTRCQNVIEFENSTESGADGFFTKCRIGLTLERIRELEGGY